jgi:hypothetical protein
MNIDGIAAIRCNYSHDELADIISNRLIGGIKFSGREERHECPALFTESTFLGIQLILLKGRYSYYLEIAQHELVDQIVINSSDFVDLTKYLISLLNTVEGISAFETGDEEDSNTV